MGVSGPGSYFVMCDKKLRKTSHISQSTFIVSSSSLVFDLSRLAHDCFIRLYHLFCVFILYCVQCFLSTGADRLIPCSIGLLHLKDKRHQ